MLLLLLLLTLEALANCCACHVHIVASLEHLCNVQLLAWLVLANLGRVNQLQQNTHSNMTGQHNSSSKQYLSIILCLKLKAYCTCRRSNTVRQAPC
jgi:hypothetical protein